ncbi:MAG: histidine kinase [Allomuricauda sp.]
MLRSTLWFEDKRIQNVAIWLFVYLIFLLFIDSDNKFLVPILGLGFLALPIYINNLKVLPLFGRKDKTLGIVLTFANVIVFTAIAALLLYRFDEEFEWDRVPNVSGILVFSLLFSSAIKISRDSFIKRQNIKEAELKLLKAQLNPHFLFNTLNNLYGLAKIKSDKLPDLMLKLSDLLRYGLYDTKEELVPIKKEIQYLENYISLEQIRLEDKTKIELSISGNDDTILIPPMLLIVFVENAFKHLGTSQKGESKVSVMLQIFKKELLFTCINTIDKHNMNYNKLETGKSGIGLDNAQKRLDLMYPTAHSLIINTSDLYHTVQLKIKV